MSAQNNVNKTSNWPNFLFPFNNPLSYVTSLLQRSETPQRVHKTTQSSFKKILLLEPPKECSLLAQVECKSLEKPTSTKREPLSVEQLLKLYELYKRDIAPKLAAIHGEYHHDKSSVDVKTLQEKVGYYNDQFNKMLPDLKLDAEERAELEAFFSKAEERNNMPRAQALLVKQCIEILIESNDRVQMQRCQTVIKQWRKMQETHPDYWRALKSNPAVFGMIQELNKQLLSLNIRLAAAVLGDTFIHYQKMFDADLERPSIAFVLDPLLTFLEHSRAIFSESCPLYYKEVMSSLQQMRDADEMCQKIYNENNTDDKRQRAFAEWMVNRIKSMEVGDSFCLGGGLKQRNGQLESALIYKITKHGKNFTFQIINTSEKGYYDKQYHQAHYDGFKKKQRLLLSKIISPAKMVMPEPWGAYFKMTYCPMVHRDYSFKDVYEHFLQSFSPTDAGESKQLAEQEFVTPRDEQTSAMGVLFGLLRVGAPDLDTYKILKLAFKKFVLQSYCDTLQTCGFFDRPADAAVLDHKAVLHFSRCCIEKFTRSVNKSLSKQQLEAAEGRELLTTLEAIFKRLQAAEKGVAVLIDQAAQKYEKELMALPDEVVELPLGFGIGETVPPKGLNIDAAFMDAHALWPEQSSAIENSLKEWLQTAQKYTPNYPRMIYQMVDKILTNMPSVASSVYWEGVPEGSRENCVHYLALMADYFFVTRPYSSNANLHRVYQVCYMQKLFAVIKKLSEQLPNDKLGIGQCIFSSEHFSHYLAHPVPRAKDERLMIFDPKLEKELIETLSFFSDPKRSSKKGIFGEDLVLTINGTGRRWDRTERMAGLFCTISSDLVNPVRVSKEDLWKSDEIAFVCRYLETFPDVKERARKELVELLRANQPAERQIPPPGDHLIVAQIFTDPEKYIGKTWAVLRKQAYQTQCFATWHTPNYIVDFQKTPLVIDPKSLEDCRISAGSSVNLLIKVEPHRDHHDRHMQIPLRQSYQQLITENQTLLEQSWEKLAKEGIYYEMRLLRTLDTPSHIAVNVIAFFKKHLNKLADEECQRLFQAMLFENNVLSTQLEVHPEFGTILAEFVHEGSQNFRAFNDIPTTLFFLRMGSFFAKYCRNANAMPKDPPFPDVVYECEELLKMENLSGNNRRFILREQLAEFCRQGRLDSSNCGVILRKMVQFKAIPVDYYVKDDSELTLEDDVRELQHKIVSLVLKADEKELSEICSTAVEKANIKWKVAFPVVSSLDENAEFQIDLANFVLYIKGAVALEILPGLPYQQMHDVFGGTDGFSDIRSNGPDYISFKDKFGYENLAIKRYNRWYFQRKIQGQYCDFYAMEKLGVTIKTTCFKKQRAWWNKKTFDVFLIDDETGKISYHYNGNSNRFTCVDSGPRKGLHLLEIGNRPSLHALQQFDEHARLWIDDDRRVKIVELPNFNMLLNVEWEKEGPKICLPAPFEGMYVSHFQSLDALKRIPNTLIIENDKGARQVLMHVETLAEERDDNRSFTGMVKFQNRKEYHHYSYYSYTLNADGSLDSPQREARLYLAYLYFAVKNYEGALQLLKRCEESLKSYSFSEQMWMSYTTKISDYDARAIAIRLRIEYLLLNNHHTFGGISDYFLRNISVRYYYDQYLSQLSHLPQYALSESQERFLADYVKKSSDRSRQIARRRHFLHDEPLLLPKKEKDHEPFRSTWLPDKFSPTIINWKIDPEILDKVPLVLGDEPQAIVTHFLSFYKIAKEEWAGSAKHNRLWSKMMLATCDGAEQYIAIIKGVMKRPFSFPSTTAIQNLSKCRDEELRGYFGQLLEIANGLEKEYAVRTPIEGALPKSTPEEAFEPVKQGRSPELPPLFTPSRLFGEGSNATGEAVFIQAEEKIRCEESGKETQALVDRLQAQEKTETGRVEARAMRELREDVVIAANQKSSKWVLQESALPALEKEIDLQVNERSGILTGILKEARNKILELANKAPTDPLRKIKHDLEVLGTGKKSLELDAIILLFLRGNAVEYRQSNPELSTEEIRKLHAEVENYLILATREQQLKRALKAIADYKAVSGKTMDDEIIRRERTQDLFTALSATRAYSVKSYPEYLVYEYKRDLLLRPEQVKSLEEMLKSGRNVVLQLIMGSGKTDLLLPLMALKQADGDILSIVMVPEELMDPISNTMHVQAGQIFHQTANRINWKLEGLESLEMIYHRLKQIRRKREFLLVTQTEMHHFYLRAHESRLKASLSGDKDAFKEQVLFRKIKRLLQRKGRVGIDEVHKVLDCRFDVRVALPLPGTTGNNISKEYIEVGRLIYDTLLSHPEMVKQVAFEFAAHEEEQKANGQKPKVELFNGQQYDQIKGLLIEIVFKQLMESNKELAKVTSQQGSLKTIQEYLYATAGQHVELPDSFSTELKNLLAFFRCEVHTILPSTLNALANERYGFFTETVTEGYDKRITQPTLLAGPYQAAYTPNVGSQFANYTELMNYTFQTYQASGLSFRHLAKELIRIKAAVLEEMKSFTIYVPQQTDAYREYVEMCGEAVAKEYNLLSLREADFKAIAATISKSTQRLNHFLKRYVLPSIPLYERILVSDAQQLPDLFASWAAFSGTPNEETLNHSCSVILAAGTNGKMLNTLWKNSRENVQVLSEESNPLKSVKEMLAGQDKKQFLAIIDAGAIFKEIGQRRLAEEVLALRPDLDAVFYFEEDKAMALLRSRPTEQIKARNVTLKEAPLNKRFVIYSQRQCTGTHVDFPPTAHAYVTMNKNSMFRDLAQAAGRMRGIHRGQVVHFAIQPSLWEAIAKRAQKEKLDILDLLLYAIRVQAHRQSEDNLISVKQQFRNVVFQACDRFLDRVDLSLLNQPMCQELGKLLVTHNPDAPYEQYGKVETLLDAKLALEHFREQTLKPLEEWHQRFKDSKQYQESGCGINPDELRALMNKSLEKALVPHKERVSEQIAVGASGDKDKEISISVRATQNVNRNQNQNQQQETENERLFNEMRRKLQPEDETPQLKAEKLFESGYLKPTLLLESEHKSLFESPCKNALAAVAQKTQSSPVLSANTLIKFHKQQYDPALQDLFEENLFLSFDLIFTEKQGAPFGLFQKPVSTCLIMQDKATDQIKICLISGREAETIKKRLIADKRNPTNEKREQRVCLYRLELGNIYQQGSDPVDLSTLKQNKKFQRMLAQMKFLSGDPMVRNAEKPEFNDWLSGRKKPEKIDLFFQTVLIKCDGLRKTYANTPLHKVFVPLFAEKT